MAAGLVAADACCSARAQKNTGADVAAVSRMTSEDGREGRVSEGAGRPLASLAAEVTRLAKNCMIYEMVVAARGYLVVMRRGRE